MAWKSRVGGQMRGMVTRVIRGRGFGFIQTEDGQQIFFHLTGLVEPIFQDLKRGDVVEFEVTQDRRGPRAVQIRSVPTAAETTGGTFG